MSQALIIKGGTSKKEPVIREAQMIIKIRTSKREKPAREFFLGWHLNIENLFQ